MAAKIKCPSCGAKNDAATHRCRICTAVINPEAVRPAASEEPKVPEGFDHFDAGDIARQVRPARERFTSTGGALSARIAAAGGPAAEPSTSEGPADDVAEVAPLDLASPLRPTAPPYAPPVEYEDEPFDPDALFRDMA